MQSLKRKYSSDILFAGYKEEGGDQRKPYNLTKLLYYIIKAVPKDKRLALAHNINEEDNWLHDDEEKDYKKEKHQKQLWRDRVGLYYRWVRHRS